jgi:F-type H+-transporting ATPase subunit epsilon
MNTLNLSLSTPEGKVFDGAVTAVQMPGTKGSFEVLFNHAPLISSLEAGPVRVRLADQSIRQYTITGGVVEVLQNQVNLLAEGATLAE